MDENKTYRVTLTQDQWNALDRAAEFARERDASLTQRRRDDLMAARLALHAASRRYVVVR
jgi:hypothetical protein